MEVDNATGQTNFKKLTPEEWVQLTKEGHCFCCRLQGHMARDCPKNSNQNYNSSACEATTTPQKPKSSSKTMNTDPTPPTKLTRCNGHYNRTPDLGKYVM